MRKLRESKFRWQVCGQITRSVCDTESEAEDLVLHIESCVEYYSSFEYRLQEPMSTRCSSRRRNSKESCAGISSPDEDAIQRKSRTKQRQSRTQPCNTVDDRNERKDRDLIHIIDDMHVEKSLYEDEAIASNSPDDSDSSIVSGPSSIHPPDNKRWSFLQDICSACQELYQRAEKMKSPILDKLLDNDPNSPTCDQWVLNKEWRPRRLPNEIGKLETLVKLVKTRLRTGVKQHARESALACLRPHTFLQRNLRPCVPKKKREKKKRWKKRPRGHSQGSAVAKKRRLHGNRQRLSSHAAPDTSDTDSNRSLSIETLCKQNIQGNRHGNAEVSSSSVSLETTMEQDVTSEEQTTKKKSGFLGLLAQLRANRSMIVRETR